MNLRKGCSVNIINKRKENGTRALQTDANARLSDNY